MALPVPEIGLMETTTDKDGKMLVVPANKAIGLLTGDQAAKYLACSTRTLRSYVSDRSLPFVTHKGGHRRFRLGDLEKWVANRVEVETVGETPTNGTRKIKTPSPFVYFIQSGEAGPIKIGIAGDVVERVAGLQTSHHEELFLRAVVRRQDFPENNMHRRFAKYRIRGEWFKPAADLLAFIAEHAK